MSLSHVFKLIFALPHFIAIASGAVVLPKGHFSVLSQTSITNHSDFPSGYGQTFAVTTDVSIAGLALSVLGMSGGSNFTVELHRYYPSSTKVDSVVLGSATVSRQSIGFSEPKWLAMYFDTPTLASAGDTLAFVLLNQDSGGAGFNRYGNSQENPYSGGSRFGGADFHGAGLYAVSLSNASDFAFEIISVPEPSGPIFYSVGFSCLFFRRRHR